MNIASIFICRPVATALVMLGMLIFGIVGYTQLPVNQLPNVDFPTIRVYASLAGADPETMAASVATPLEKQFATIAGIDSMSSISTSGRTSIVIQFDLDRSIDAAALDVQSAISTAQGRLPASMTTPPSFRKVNPADFPILYLRVSSNTLPAYKLNEYADTLIAQRLSMINGIAQVNVYGQKKYAVRVRLNPDALASRNLGIDEVANAIVAANSKLPTGTLEGKNRASSIKSSGQLENAADFSQVVVSYHDGAPVRLGDLGEVADSVETEKQLSWGTGSSQSMTLAVERQPGSNAVEIVEDIKKILPSLQKQLPPSVEVSIFFDRSESIKESVFDVKFTLILTIFLVIFVIFIFLLNIPATIIPSLALPMSIISTFAVMQIFGYSLNNLSLMALTLAVGFVVDDAIVMLENIVRHQEMGKTPMQAAFDGSKEISFTILSMTISLVAVFIPVFFMGGIVGRLFREFSVVIITAILFSGFVSLTLTPMLCAYFLKSKAAHGNKSKRFWLYVIIENALNSLNSGYKKSLLFVLSYRKITLIVSFLLFFATAYLFVIIPKGFLPIEDLGFLASSTVAEQGISFNAMVKAQRTLAPIIDNNPHVRSYNSLVGDAGPNQGMNNGMLLFSLKPFDERPGIREVAARLREELNKSTNLRVFIRLPASITIGGRSSRSLYQYTLTGLDAEALYDSAGEIEQVLRSLPELQDVNSDLQLKNPELRINIDRNRAAVLGVSPEQIELALQSAYGAREISTIYTPVNDYSVFVELQKEYQEDISALSKLYVRSKYGVLVPLDTLATFEKGLGPISVNHSGQFPAVTISYNLATGVSLGDAVNAIERAVRPILPDSVTAESQGTAQAFAESLTGMGWLLFLSILVIYLVLGILYESFIHPLTILSGLPSAGFGALLTLWIFNIDLNLYSFVGIIMLVGIAKKNAIMMLDFAIEAQKKDKNITPLDAITNGCLVRFRPIMMTTMAALMGAIPIAIGIGAGGEARRPLGIAVVGGLCFSQIVTLYITPVYYYYLELFSQYLKKNVAKNFEGHEEELKKGGRS